MRDDAKKDDTKFIPHPSSYILKLRRVLRGDVKVHTIAREAWRRSHAALQQRHERATLDQLNKRPARLHRDFERLSATELLNHFRSRATPQFLPGFNAQTKEMAELQQTFFPTATTRLIESARRIAHEHRWTLLGYKEMGFGDPIEWRRDIVSGEFWPLDYHADISLARDGSDVRVLWELNRLAHFITLGRAYALTRDEQLAEAFFVQLESWRTDNPVGRGPNWTCAMEVALRAMNLLAAFQLFRSSPSLNETRLMQMLAMFEAHGAHIRRNSEFSYIGTSNHYLSDIVGLFWLGIMLPELKSAKHWREVGKREMLREMEVQILNDGADFEASTGYHRFVLELFLYSFILSHANQSDIPDRYLRRLHAMLTYLRAYLRPDGHAPLIGDTDSGQIIPVVRRDADDHAYVLEVGAAFLQDGSFKLDQGGAITEELLWILGPQGVRNYRSLPANSDPEDSTAFSSAGTFVMRDGDLYLLFNASGIGVNGRGSHGHNDALSIEVSACGTPFVVDPGTYVYRTDLDERNMFRSTAYHSTVEVDGREQNTIIRDLPFVIGDEAHPRVLSCEMNQERDLVIAEHNGYAQLDQPITHRRAVEFDKRKRVWIIEDSLLGEGEHHFSFRFHLALGLEAIIRSDGIVVSGAGETGPRLLIVPLDIIEMPELEPRWTSRDYGEKMTSVSVCWSLRARAPINKRWAIVPVCENENEMERGELVEHLRKK